MPYDRAGRAHRPLRGGARRHQGRDGRRAVLVRRRALHDHRLRRPAQAGAAPRPPSSSAAAASGCCRSPPARPTSSASTASLHAGVIGPDAIATMTAEAVDDKVAHRARRRAGGRIDDIELQHPGVPRQRHRRPRPARRRHGAGCSASTRRWSPTSPFALIGSDGDDRRRPERSAASGWASATSSSAPTTSTPSPRRRRPRRHLTRPIRSVRRAIGVSRHACRFGRDRALAMRFDLGSRQTRRRRSRPFSMTMMPSSLTVNRSRSSARRGRCGTTSGTMTFLSMMQRCSRAPGADVHAREEDRVGDVGVVVDVAARGR